MFVKINYEKYVNQPTYGEFLKELPYCIKYFFIHDSITTKPESEYIIKHKLHSQASDWKFYPNLRIIWGDSIYGHWSRMYHDGTIKVQSYYFV